MQPWMMQNEWDEEKEKKHLPLALLEGCCEIMPQEKLNYLFRPLETHWFHEYTRLHSGNKLLTDEANEREKKDENNNIDNNNNYNNLRVWNCFSLFFLLFFFFAEHLTAASSGFFRTSIDHWLIGYNWLATDAGQVSFCLVCFATVTRHLCHQNFRHQLIHW